ncbi:MAG: 50S ribosomal protein L23 [Desulfonatronovibrionaceae bacterium]
MELTQVLIKPIITEKATELKETSGKVAFRVHPDANKYLVKQAVEHLFNVDVENVNMVRSRPRVRRKFGRSVGKQPGYKKAYVTLSPGDKIEFFEGV